MREKLYRFMQGRYGVDQLSKFLLILGLVLVLGSNFVGGLVVNTLGFAVVLYTYFRIFSKNHPKRYKENQLYLRFTSKIRIYFQRQKSHMKQRKTHHIYSCPNCKQKIRVPKGKGKLEISCPKCHTKFIKRS